MGLDVHPSVQCIKNKRMVVKISAKQPQMCDAHGLTHMCDSMYMRRISLYKKVTGTKIDREACGATSNIAPINRN